ncbi:tRNA lysidine(34) synthetase TilS [uncultured Jatrophihabitans sp.]|uniref:tRNA lysidine(34) synthetase TilS n=1 Tax=uncultured Jatrophihabitans sp. TaxID=1610747 RepID=UPI0035C9AA4D
MRRAVRAELGRGSLLVACSGGADSLALAAAVAFEAPRAGVAAGLVTVDHGLQAGSADQAARVAAIGHELGLDPVLTLDAEVGSTGGPEAAARAARYAALDEVAERLGADVLLGHTLDDQAETVLLGLGRGSGPRSIAGMAAVDGRYVRPLLGIRRSTTEAACAALGLTPWSDPHNIDPRFQRVRLRTEVLPLLDDVLQGGVVPALARTADLLRDDLEALDVWAATEVVRASTPSDASGGGQLEVAGLIDLPRAVRTRVLRAWAVRVGAAPLSAGHTAALDALITDWHGQGPVPLPGGVHVFRASGRLEAEPHEQE